MKQCPLSSHPVGEDGRCTSHACKGYGDPSLMQKHADWLREKKGITLEGWEPQSRPTQSTPKRWERKKDEVE